WHHIKSDAMRGMFNRGEQTLCLKNNHKIMTVGDAVDMAWRHGTALHQNQRDCRCALCTEMRHTYHCRSPWRCYQRAQVLLDTLPDKLNLLCPQPEDYKNMAGDAPEDKSSEVLFDTRITVTGTLADMF
ncbi:hypothetical protein B0H14DRAFT_2368960, partial [Mycena olivaceomarginata]